MKHISNLASHVLSLWITYWQYLHTHIQLNFLIVCLILWLYKWKRSSFVDLKHIFFHYSAISMAFDHQFINIIVYNAHHYTENCIGTLVSKTRMLSVRPALKLRRKRTEFRKLLSEHEVTHRDWINKGQKEIWCIILRDHSQNCMNIVCRGLMNNGKVYWMNEWIYGK